MSEMEDIFMMVVKVDRGGEYSTEEDKEDVARKAEEMFLALDEDGDGELSQEEFINGCLCDEELVRQLRQTD